MSDYKELIEALRFCARWHMADDALANAEQAADAIEELEKERDYYKQQYENRQRLIKSALGEEWT